ncbi:MAG: helix-turn-helix domain-containing protein [Sphingomonadales bacterium]|nr:helix-turn-helix domain-containing protein [Sphingomonadales bacterium]
MAEFRPIEISSEHLPVYNPDEFAREFFGRIGQRMELEPQKGTPITIRANALPLAPGLIAGGGSISAMTSHRTSAMRSDGNSDILICFPVQRMLMREAGGREFAAGPGQAVLGSLDRPVSFVSPERRNDFVTLQLSRAMLSPYVTSIDDKLMRASDASDPRLRLLRGYAASLAPDALASPHLRDLAARHLLELAALAIGPTADGHDAAMRGGLRAARLAQAKQVVMAHLERPELSAAFVAARVGVTERYVRKLFEGEDESLATFISARRLDRAMTMLADSTRRDRRILDIALSLGFGDVRTFNRAFRARFDRTPSEMRHEARAS